MSDDLNFLMEDRRAKLAALEAAGIPAFAYRYDRTHAAAAAVAALAGGATDGERVSVAGRIVAWREHGKTTFAHLADETGRIQLYIKQDIVGADAYGTLPLFDIGDVIGAEGALFRTRTGEVTVRVESLTMLAKSLRPLPYGKEEKVEGSAVATVRHGGLADSEQRSRQRYVDLAVHPEVRALFAKQHEVVFAKTKLTLTVASVWFISEEVALVDGSYSITGIVDPKGTEIPERKGLLTSVLLKEKGKWWIAASRLMIPAPLPWRRD